jgi:uncharacterized protein (TIGR02145 family)
MKKIVTVLLVLVFAKASAQNYLISFAGNGASSTIDSIKVQNLMQGTSVTISGTDTLNLLGTNGVKSSLNQDNKLLQIYPNPSEQTSQIKIEKTESGPTSIDVFNISGKRIIHSDFDLGVGEHEFQISNLNPGLHQIVVSSQNHVVTGKIISNYTGTETTVLRQLNVNGTSLKGSRINVTTAYVAMQYTQGDRLLLTAYSVNYKSVKTTVPTASGLYSFTFFACTDVDNYNYATVQIGTQVWMKENLKVSKYRNGDPISTGLSDEAWGSTTTGAYAIYNNDASNNTTYGKLYNWYAVADSRNLCPVGWHVPSDAEWTTLENYLGGASVAGGKLKSTSTLWTAPNAEATNQSGFSGLPGGSRLSNGTYTTIGNYGYWWSSTEYSTTFFAWFRYLNYYYGNSSRGNNYKQNGFSVRCLRD